MAKKNNYIPGDLQRQQEDIRKAKGNPNKNIHRKKNGANYGGYAAQSAHERMEREEKQKEKLPRPMVITLVILFVAVTAMLILRQTLWKENITAFYVLSLLLGGTCLFLLYVNRYRRKKTTGTTVMSILLGIIGVLYTVLALLGLLGMVQL